MKTLYELARDYSRYLETRLVAASDDLNRPLTDAEVIEAAKYYLDTLDYTGFEDSEIAEYKSDCRHIIRIGQNRERKAAERAAQN